MICRACGQDKPDTPEHWYFRDGKRDGRVCKKCRHRGPKLIPICHHCGTPILDEDGKPVNAQTHYHRTDDYPACQQAYRLNKLHASRKYDQRYRAERKAGLRADKPTPTGRPCPRKCKKCRLRRNGVALLPQNYFYACPEYYSRNHSVRIDDDYIYMAWAYSGHPKPNRKDEAH